MKYDSIKRKIFFSKITWLKMASVVSCRLAASGQSVPKLSVRDKALQGVVEPVQLADQPLGHGG